MAGQHILILGSGSVGQRHARNLYSLGCEISCMDPRPDRLEQVALEVPVRYKFASEREAFGWAGDFSGVVVCSPPKFHVEQSLLALDAGLPLLLEKPVSPDATGCRQLHLRLEKGGKALLGYTYRWWQPVRRLKALIDARTVGTVRHVRIVMSAHLADWHPWENYQDFFMASQELGGGALLDESHFIDLLLWFFGKPERVFARVEKISDLEITSDDLVDISAAYANGLRATIHLDLFGRPHEKSIAVAGETGTLMCHFAPDEVRLCRSPEAEWETESFNLERNDMFMEVAREFLDLVKGDQKYPTCTVSDGLRVLEVIEACRQSQQTGREIVLSASHD